MEGTLRLLLSILAPTDALCFAIRGLSHFRRAGKGAQHLLEKAGLECGKLLSCDLYSLVRLHFMFLIRYLVSRIEHMTKAGHVDKSLVVRLYPAG